VVKDGKGGYGWIEHFDGIASSRDAKAKSQMLRRVGGYR
jgi:hypothetical protein